MTRTFEALPAKREQVNLFIGLVGPSSSGKTWSALELAQGIQYVVGGDIYVIDTENRRATFYASNFTFKHVDFPPPHGSLDYLAAIEYCEKQGAKTIIIDSASHEHEGEGGMLEFWEKEQDRMAGGDFAKRDRIKMLAIQKPKADRAKLRRYITSKTRANIIMCFRAKHISKPIKVNGRTEVVDQGFVPIAAEEFVFEMQLSALLPPNSQGVPNWNPENPGERLAVKVPNQFRDMIRLGAPINFDLGRDIAEWAVGGIDGPALAAHGKTLTGEAKQKWWDERSGAEKEAIRASTPSKTEKPHQNAPEAAQAPSAPAAQPRTYADFLALLVPGADASAVIARAKEAGVAASLIGKLTEAARERGL